MNPSRGSACFPVRGYPHADRLYQICEMPNPGDKISIASGGAFIDWQKESTQFDAIAAAHSVEENLTGVGEPVRLSGYQQRCYEVRAHPANPDLVVAAASVGLCVSRDSGRRGS